MSLSRHYHVVCWCSNSLYAQLQNTTTGIANFNRLLFPKPPPETQLRYFSWTVSNWSRAPDISSDFSRETISPTTLHSLQFENLDQNFQNLDYLVDVQERKLKPLEECTEDLSYITPDFPVSFNFAGYANKSPMIQKLVQLGVDFSKLERRKGIMKFLLPLDFEKDMNLHLRFLNDCGVSVDQLGYFLTKNPLIFKEDLDDLHTRIRYLRAHKFTLEMISRIVGRNPYWLMFSTKRIDARLGYFQRNFSLNGRDVRILATKQPRLITYSLAAVRENIFAVAEEMGFSQDEQRQILLEQPQIFMKSRSHLVELFDFAHNIMKLPHDIIAEQPHILTCRLHRLRQRHMFLVTQDRAQYDPQKPMYVSLKALVSKSDAEFSMDVAKTTVQIFNMFLKTL
ncbi:transcription termination factor 3, mitochondrial [Athalia rosae]|uniref:transcription termination factor 3, mitochondrial n=1 Tax=Athalia rosae TaxID=37344 RepID=UPI0020336472|nr:transcription termination factor 3, mitochondrial [Athalia rosae]